MKITTQNNNSLQELAMRIQDFINEELIDTERVYGIAISNIILAIEVRQDLEYRSYALCRGVTIELSI